MGAFLETEGGELVRGAAPLPYGVLVLFSPRYVYSRVEDTPAYGWALAFLIGLTMLIGYARVQTGLIDRDVDEATETKMKMYEQSQGQLIDRVEFREHLESIQKEGIFAKTMNRLAAVVLSPMGMLGSLMLTASILYAAVALTGRKPEYHTLMSICVYAAFIELAAMILQLAMMLYFKSTAVDTTLRGLGVPGKPSAWGAVDPFRIWFWVLVAIGLAVTHQLSRRMAIVMCTLMCLFALGIRMAMQFAGA